jgi:cytoskeletal protein RodZ
MALSADEQRELAEIERRLATDDPGLATCLAAFRRPGPSRVLRSPRARIIGSLFTVLLVAMISLMVYAMIPFRAHNPSSQTTAGTSATPASTDGQARNSPLASASTDASATGAASPAPSSAAASTGTSQAKPTESQAEGQVASSAAGP